jgi:hypothetical protein
MPGTSDRTRTSKTPKTQAPRVGARRKVINTTCFLRQNASGVPSITDIADGLRMVLKRKGIYSKVWISVDVHPTLGKKRCAFSGRLTILIRS